MNTLTRIVAASALLGLATLPGLAETIGPAGETATPTASIVLGDDQVAAVQAANYTAALLWHDQSDFVSAVTAGASDEFSRLGIEVVAVTSAGFDAAKQRSDIETAMARNPSIILSLRLIR